MSDNEEVSTSKVQSSPDNNQELLLSHRFYEEVYPSEGNCVVAKVIGHTDYCVVVQLLEYDNIEAFLPFSAISNKRQRQTPQKMMPVTKIDVLQVTKVDHSGNKVYIECTKKNMSASEREECDKKFNKSKALHSIMSHLAHHLHRNIDDLYQKIVYPLYHSEEIEHPIDMFEKLGANESELSTIMPEFMQDETKEIVLGVLKHHFGAHKVKMHAEVEVSCFTEEGIEAIIASLSEAQKLGNEGEFIKVNVISAPLYSMSLQTTDPKIGTQVIQRAISVARTEIEKRKGSLEVKLEPVIASA